MKELLKHLKIYKNKSEPVVEKQICDNSKFLNEFDLAYQQRIINNLEEGEIICSECNGTGVNRHGTFEYVCSKCQGDGKLDWVENVVGKKVKYIDGTSVSNINII